MKRSDQANNHAHRDPHKSTSFSASSLQTLIVRVSVLLAHLATGIITARWLGPHALGIYYLVALLPGMAFHFGNLGFGTAFSFFGAREKASGRQLHLLSWSIGLILAAASGIVLVLVRPLGFSPWREIDPRLFFFFLAAVPLEFWLLYSQRVLNGKLRITQVNISAAIRGYGGVAFLVLFVIVLDLRLPGALLAVVSSMVVACLYLLRQTLRVARISPPEEGVPPTAKLVGEMWRYGRWTYLILLISYLCVQLPVLFLARFCATDAVAFYSIAKAFARKSEMLTLPFSAILLPFTAAAEEAEATRRTNTLCRVFVVVMLLLTGLLVAAVPLIIPLLYGAAYTPAVKVIWFTAPGILLWPLGTFLGLHVVGSGRPRTVFLADIGVLATAVVSGALLIPRFGAIGAAMSFTCINSGMFVFRLLTYRRLTGAALSEILVPRRSDAALCSKALSRFLAGFPGRSRDA